MIKIASIRIILMILNQNEIWKFNEIIPLTILGGICFIKILQLLENEQDRSKDVIIEMKVLTFMILIIIKAWYWSMSLFSFVFVINTQFMEKEQ